MKSPSASTTASILDRNHLQALTTVALSRLPITSLIFEISELVMLWGALFTCNSETPHTK
jgi:hypothetical protein